MMRVVVADDEARVCQLICGLVDWREFGMEIAGVAHDGRSALELIGQTKPGLVITDIRMPGMDGLETIKLVKEELPGTEFIIISGYRDFEYAQTAIKYGVGDYLLKPVKKEELISTLLKLSARSRERAESISNEEELKRRLRGDLELTRERLFKEVLLSAEKEALPLERLNGDYRYSFMPGAFQAFSVKMDFARPADCTEAGLAVAREKVGRIFCAMNGDCFDMELYFEKSWAFGVINYAQEEAQRIKKKFASCVDELLLLRTLFGHMEFTVGLGGVKSEAGGLSASMAEAEAAAMQRLMDAGSRVIQCAGWGDIQGRENILAAWKSEIAAALELLDVSRAAAAAAKLSEDALSQREAGGQRVFELANEAFELFLSVLKSAQNGVSELAVGVSKSFYAKAGLYLRAQDLFGFLGSSVENSIEELLEQKKQSQTKPIRIAKKFILEHYMEPVTLEEVSGVAGFNASYFSTLFKRECGVTFLEFLSETRISKAKELIKETDLSLAEICGRVGYLDIKHFNKTFQKYVGVKPAEYRKLYS